MLFNSPKTVQIVGNILPKIKNVITDFPEYSLSSTKVFNTIIYKWLEENKK